MKNKEIKEYWKEIKKEKEASTKEVDAWFLKVYLLSFDIPEENVGGKK